MICFKGFLATLGMTGGRKGFLAMVRRMGFLAALGMTVGGAYFLISINAPILSMAAIISSTEDSHSS